MSAYVLSPRARRDLEEIWNYTADRWGEDQADRYVLRLHRAIETIANDPSKGRSCDHLRAGYRRYSAAAHLLFFRAASDGIEVVRVLHQSMDFERHL
jgi:toxin ParE1/3/4